MGGISNDELAAETARRVRKWEDENKCHAGVDDIRLAAYVVIEELSGMHCYTDKVVRKTIEILTGRY